MRIEAHRQTVSVAQAAALRRPRVRLSLLKRLYPRAHPHVHRHRQGWLLPVSGTALRKAPAADPVRRQTRILMNRARWHRFFSLKTEKWGVGGPIKSRAERRAASAHCRLGGLAASYPQFLLAKLLIILR